MVCKILIFVSVIAVFYLMGLGIQYLMGGM